MQLEFGGVRGSRPVCDPAHVRFGGETTSVLVTGSAGQQVLLDAGTGLRCLRPRLASDSGRPLLLLFSHYHLDHISGLPSLEGLYRSEQTLMVSGPGDPAAAVTGLLNHPYWPVPLVDMACELRYQPAPLSDPLEFEGLMIRCCPVVHPGGCLAWRIDETASGESLVFATDMEWPLMQSTARSAFLEFCRTPSPVDLLVMDGHYSRESYPGHEGWGHSTDVDVLDVGQACGAGRILITHHAPERDDSLLADLEGRLAESGNDARNQDAPLLARQGLVISLSDCRHHRSGG